MNYEDEIDVRIQAILGKPAAAPSSGSQPVYFNYAVVGVTFEGRQDILRDYYDEHFRTGKKRSCKLVLEDDNQYDKNAIAVYIIGDDKEDKIGYISKDDNVFLRSEYKHITGVRISSMGLSSNSNIGLTITVKMENKS